VGGLIVSQALTLYTTPVIYLYLDRLRLWFERVRGGRGRGIAASASYCRRGWSCVLAESRAGCG
jgi:hypothetical protein